MDARLICHPSTPTAVIESIEVSLSRRGDRLHLRFTIIGVLDRLRIPQPATPRVADRLWEHTCCEAFIRNRDSAAYHELNFSPSGEWAEYAFRAYRERSGDAAAAVIPPLIVCASDDRLTLEAHVELSRLEPRYATEPVCVGLSAVIEARDGSQSYWALRHSPGRPDFHHTDAFALTLEATGGG